MLGITSRRVLLSIHLALNSILIGGLVAVVVLNYAKQGSQSGDQQYAINLALFKIHDTVVMNAGMGVIVTGLLFSLFTKWGFFDFYWVTMKWVGVALLFFVMIFYMAPAINGMAALSDVQRIQALGNPLYGQYEKQSAIFAALLLALLVAMIVLSVFKPWGQRAKPFNVSRKVVLGIGGGLGVIVIASALLQFMQLQSYRRMPVKDIDLATIADGAYIGEAKFGFTYKVEVAIKDHKIDRIKIIENYNSMYAKLAEGVIERVLGAQRPNIDAVTGATTTSKCLMKAIENAIERGGIQR
jgi:uncharacterized protein with FMN-binding domain